MHLSTTPGASEFHILDVMQTVLVTGSAGRLGQAAVGALLREGHQVIGIDCRPTPGLPSAIVDDLQQQTTLRAMMRGVSAVIHLAATPDDSVWPLPAQAGDNFLTHLVPNNLISSYNVLEAARHNKVAKVILASTGQVVWDQSYHGPFPISVDAKPTPRWWYASTKLMLEAIGEAYTKQGFFSVIAVRLGFCPRDSHQVLQIAGDPRDQDVYLSPGDAGLFFDCCVKAKLPANSFHVLYAASNAPHLVRFDLEPAKRLIGFQPRDTWPTGVTVPNIQLPQT